MSRAAAFAVSLAYAGGLGCGGSHLATDLAQPPEYRPDQQSKCRVTQSQLKPLVIEWPAAERAALEAQRQEGLAVVRYDGCEMELLARCAAPGRYAFVPVTPKRENVSIRNADELYATIPAYAASFEGKLERAGRLDVHMTIVGVYQSKDAPTRDALQGDCAGATHVVRALTVGAFEFSAGGSAEVGAGAALASASSGTKSSASREMLSSDGDPANCTAAVANGGAPPFGCSALLRIEVAALAAPTAHHSAPSVATTAPPATTPPNRPPLLDALKQ